jgi:CheY-like chemotaxis protein
LLYYAVNGVLIAAMNHLKQIQENIEQHRFFVELDDKLRSLVDADEIALTAATCMGRYLKAARCGYADVSDNGEEFNLAGNYVDGVAARGALFIALTGYGQEQDREDSKAAGFHYHFVKPADVNALSDALSKGVPG